jgi:hypothetical protein
MYQKVHSSLESKVTYENLRVNIKAMWVTFQCVVMKLCVNSVAEEAYQKTSVELYDTHITLLIICEKTLMYSLILART